MKLDDSQLSLLKDLLAARYILVVDAGGNDEEIIVAKALELYHNEAERLGAALETLGQIPTLMVYNTAQLDGGKSARYNKDGLIEIAIGAGEQNLERDLREVLVSLIANKIAPGELAAGKSRGKSISEEDRIPRNRDDGSPSGFVFGTGGGRAADLTQEPEIITQPSGTGKKRNNPGLRNIRRDVKRTKDFSDEAKLKEMYFYFSLAEKEGTYTLGGFLRVLRLTAGLGQQQMADKIGILQPNYANYEINKIPVPLGIISKIIFDNILNFADIDFEDRKGNRFQMPKDQFITKFIKHTGHGERLAAITPGDQDEIFAALAETLEGYKKGEVETLPSARSVMAYLMSYKKLKAGEWGNINLKKPEYLDTEKFFDPPLKLWQSAILHNLPFTDGGKPRHDDLLLAYARREAKDLGSYLAAFRIDSKRAIATTLKVSKARIDQIELSQYLENFSLILSKKNAWNLPADEYGAIRPDVIDDLHRFNMRGIYNAMKPLEKAGPISLTQFNQLISDPAIDSPRTFLTAMKERYGIKNNVVPSQTYRTITTVINNAVGLPEDETGKVNWGAFKRWYNKFMREPIEQGTLIARGGRE